MKSETPVLHEKEHDAPDKLLMEGGVGGDFVELNDDVGEECGVFCSERHCVARDDGSLDIEEFPCAIELVCFMD